MARLLSGSILEDQIELERKSVEDGVARYRAMVADSVRRGDGGASKSAERIIMAWIPAMTEAVASEQREIRGDQRSSNPVGRSWYGGAFAVYDQEPEKLAFIALREIIGQCLIDPSPSGPTLIKLAFAIGKTATAMMNEKDLRRVYAKQWKEYKDRFRRHSVARLRGAAKRIMTDREDMSRRTQIHIGTRLVWLAIQVCSAAPEGQKFALAFRKVRTRENRRTKTMIVMDPAVTDAINSGHAVREVLRPIYLPMVVQPLKRTEDGRGGYAQIRTPLVARPTAKQKAAIKRADMDETYAGLDAIAASGMRVNPFTHRVAKQMFEDGGDVAGLPRYDILPMPPQPAVFEGEAKTRWKAEAHRIHVANKLSRGARSHVLSVFHIAEMFKDVPFWFPHQLDFRSRAYPIPVHLNHHGDDLCRGLLTFADGKDASDALSRFWLKVHVANCWANDGLDKKSFADRVVWVDDHEKQIAKVGKDPIGIDWWQKAELPWQFVAACRAMVDKDAAAHLPTQWDGSNNGLQHYAALARDEQTAATVNLVASDTPQSAYKTVAASMMEIVEADAREGNEHAKACLPYLRKSCVQIVKQPTMTRYYDATVIGFKTQIRNKLIDLGMTKPESAKPAYYLAKRVVQAIGAKFKMADDVMTWFRNCARVAVKAGVGLSWDTELGFPVVQPYQKVHKVRLFTSMQQMVMVYDSKDAPIAPMRQVRGFAPNVIHSIDATHMFRTAIACRHAGVAFASVHDSFWTHAATATELHRTLRQEFVNLHELPILERMAKQMKRLCPSAEFPPLPPRGNFNIKDAIKAPYAFA